MKSLLLVAVQLLVCFATESYSEHLESKVEDVEATKRSQRRLKLKGSSKPQHGPSSPTFSSQPRRVQSTEEETSAAGSSSNTSRRTSKVKMAKPTAGGDGRYRIAAWPSDPSDYDSSAIADLSEKPLIDFDAFPDVYNENSQTSLLPNNRNKRKNDKKHFRTQFTVIDAYSLGNRRPEGITAGEDDSTVYVSEFLYGGIKRINVTSGAMEQIVSSYGYLERPIGGLVYYNNTLVAAGLGAMFDANQAKLYVHDATTGNEIVSCTPPVNVGVINDVTIMDDIAYATDGRINQLIVMDMHDAIAGKCNITSIQLPANEFFSDDAGEIRAAGIAAYDGGLIISNFRTGGLYYVNPHTGQAVELVAREELPMPTGLAVHDDNVYVTSSHSYSVSIWKLRPVAGGGNKEDETDRPRATYKGSIVSEYLDDPRSTAILNGYLYAVNSKAKSTGLPAEGENQPWFSEEFDMVEVEI